MAGCVEKCSTSTGLEGGFATVTPSDILVEGLERDSAFVERAERKLCGRFTMGTATMLAAVIKMAARSCIRHLCNALGELDRGVVTGVLPLSMYPLHFQVVSLQLLKQARQYARIVQIR